jgi:hypothetical protein
MSIENFSLREIRPSDSARLVKLITEFEDDFIGMRSMAFGIRQVRSGLLDICGKRCSGRAGIKERH